MSAALDFLPCLYDYQRDIADIAIAKRKYAVFADCGLGKTLILAEYAKHVLNSLPSDQCALIVSPLMVANQTIAECKRFYGDSLPIELVKASNLSTWLERGSRLGITNYEAVRDGLRQGRLGALILDESSMLKSHYGKWGRRLIDLGKGLDWKLCLTGTPAPNDRIEYANHAVFLDQFPTVNAFLARYFVNRGQTDNRWELKPHALRPFYRDLSHWCIFLTDPSVYGWSGNGKDLPPIKVHIHDVPLTRHQRDASMELTRGLFSEAGGFVQRGKLARLAKGISPTGKGKVPTRKPQFIKRLIESWPSESTILWCNYNREQDDLAKLFPEAASIAGETPIDQRLDLIGDFQSTQRRTLISKPKVLGFGLNLQVATRQVFSSLVDSYESYYQAVKRSNRIGSDRPLNVHIPVTEIEQPMVANVLSKAARVQSDAEEQEQLFREARRAG
jgi:superfamily II DNA or RNA helicase